MGVKRVNDKLTRDQRALLEGLPSLTVTSASVIEGHRAVADVFLRRAKAIVEDWPHGLEDATRAHLRRELGFELS